MTGMVALTNAVDHGDTADGTCLPADPQALPLMKADAGDGPVGQAHGLTIFPPSPCGAPRRWPRFITAMPLLYGSYTVTRGPGTFTLEPPLDLNLAGLAAG